jgi:hypothetical protein
MQPAVVYKTGAAMHPSLCPAVPCCAPQGAQLCYRQALKLSPAMAEVRSRLDEVVQRLKPEQPIDFPDLKGQG